MSQHAATENNEPVLKTLFYTVATCVASAMPRTGGRMRAELDRKRASLRCRNSRSDAQRTVTSDLARVIGMLAGQRKVTSAGDFAGGGHGCLSLRYLSREMIFSVGH